MSFDKQGLQQISKPKAASAKPKGAITINEPKAKKSGHMTINVKVNHLHAGGATDAVVRTKGKKMQRYGVKS